MKTIEQITQEHITRLALMVNDGDAMMEADQAQQRRLAKRFENDPALSIFIRTNAQAMMSVLAIAPEPARYAIISEMLSNAIISWEDINREFEEQFKTGD